MTQPLSIEDENWTYLITTRTADSRLWLIDSKQLEAKILGILARYQEIYGAILYAFILMGNHYHLVAKFPGRNRALFMRDFNSAVARVVGRYVKAHGRRSVWARRYSYQILPRSEDIMHWFFYAALNPVSSGLCRTIASYRSYNSFQDAAAGRTRTCEWLDWSKYTMKRRYNPAIEVEQFITKYELSFSRLPGFEHLSATAYAELLHTELQKRQTEKVAERDLRGQKFMADFNRSPKQGDRPFSTKTSTRTSYRPLVLTLCSTTKRAVLDTYFRILDRFKEASDLYRNKNTFVQFPSGTYPPPKLRLT